MDFFGQIPDNRHTFVNHRNFFPVIPGFLRQSLHLLFQRRPFLFLPFHRFLLYHQPLQRFCQVFFLCPELFQFSVLRLRIDFQRNIIPVFFKIRLQRNLYFLILLSQRPKLLLKFFQRSPGSPAEHMLFHDIMDFVQLLFAFADPPPHFPPAALKDQSRHSQNNDQEKYHSDPGQ